jgi:nitrogen-specific signal transduction histidine kinase
MQDLLRAGDADEAELVLALCHEIGNLVGAVRLHAHLIDDQMGTRDLALVSVELDDLSARASALLAHPRPLLSNGPGTLAAVSPAAVLGGIQRLMDEHGGRGAKVSFDVAAGLPDLQVDLEVVHRLLESLLWIALESASSHGSVSLRAEAHPRGVAFVIEDDGEVDEDPALWGEQMLRGRPLLCAVAQNIVGKRGGRLEVSRNDGSTRVVVVLPGG